MCNLILCFITFAVLTDQFLIILLLIISFIASIIYHKLLVNGNISMHASSMYVHAYVPVLQL